MLGRTLAAVTAAILILASPRATGAAPWAGAQAAGDVLRSVGGAPVLRVADGFFVLAPALPGERGFELRGNAALERMCGFDDALNSPVLDERSTEVALAKLWHPACGRRVRTRFDPEGRDLANLELVNRWLGSVTEIGEVGTDLSDKAKAINTGVEGFKLASKIAAGLTFGGALPPPFAQWVAPVAALGTLLSLVQPDSDKCRERYDYDMGLTGAVRILHLFGSYSRYAGRGRHAGRLPTVRIDPDVERHVVSRLLTARGDASEWRHHPRLCAIELALVPETENHQLMTESSRYLTNQLIRNALNPAHSPAVDATAEVAKYVNSANGMRDALLRQLAGLLRSDFHEYNSRPYARLSTKALHNLYDFAEDPEVSRGAQLVLDYLSGKFAVSSSALRRSVPFRRRSEYEGVAELLTDNTKLNTDEETLRFLQLSGATHMLDGPPLDRRVPDGAAGTMLAAYTSGYQVPDLVQDLILHEANKREHFERIRHEGYELYYGAPLFLIAAGGVFRPGWDETWWQHVIIDAAASAVVGNPVLGTILGETVIRDAINGIAESEAASALPTVLIPTGGGTDEAKRLRVDRRNFIRIDGSTERKRRNNTCVSPPGFACGVNPVIPDSIGPACRWEGPGAPIPIPESWTFVNLHDAPGCPLDYGLYVAFWRAPCETGNDCQLHAGGEDPAFGFFEVAVATQAGRFDDFVRTVLARNGGRTYRGRDANDYTTSSGRTIRFIPVLEIDQWPILGTPEAFDMKTWQRARGDILNSRPPFDAVLPTDGLVATWRDACVEIDNPTLRAATDPATNWRRVLDFSRVHDPVWCDIPVSENPIKHGCKRERCAPLPNN